MENKPLKRNKNIVILSREHHHGLLFAWKLRQGLRICIAQERIAKYVAYFWGTHLMEHFREEEDLLFNQIRHDLVDIGIRQHGTIRALIHCIIDEDKGNAEAYARLADLLTDHIRFEERELFPYLESAIPPEQLSRIGDELTRLNQEPASDDYPDQFWLNKKPPNDAANG